MKKITVFASCLFLVISLIGCSNSNNSQQDNSHAYEIEIISYHTLSIEVPTDWTVNEKNGDEYIYPTGGGLIVIKHSEGTAAGINDYTEEGVLQIGEAYLKGLSEKEGNSLDSDISVAKHGDVWFVSDGYSYTNDSQTIVGDAICILSNHELYFIAGGIPENADSNLKKQYDDVISSITVIPDPNAKSSKATSSSSSSSASSNNSQQSSSITTSQKNALSKAQSYLKSSAFSYKGLIEQLEYEGYSQNDATYAVDNCGANWNDQALKKAKQYLSTQAFSYTGLIEQLEFEGFTNEQTLYGVDNCGANWNEQAAKKAASYLNYQSFSREGLIDQLEFEGFTAEQAAYGADSVGL